MKFTSTWKTAQLIFLPFVFSACAQNSDNGAAPPGPNNPINRAASAPEIIGNWAKPCASGGSAQSSKNTFLVDDQHVQIQTDVYPSNADCTGAADLQSRAQFQYVVNNDKPGQVNAIDMTLQQVLARLNTDKAVAAANIATFCGFKDWKLSVDKDVTGKNCIADIPDANNPYYQIFKVSGTDLFIGEVNTQHTGRTPESRPTVLETTAYKNQ